MLAGLIGAAIIFMGTSFFWAPQGAVGFGIPDTPTEGRSFHAWLSVKGVRDIAAGIVIFIVLVGGTTHLLGRARDPHHARVTDVAASTVKGTPTQEGLAQ